MNDAGAWSTPEGVAGLTRRAGLSEMQWDLAMEAAGIGGFDWDLDSGKVHPDDRLQRLFGYAPGEFVAESDAFERVHPDDRILLDRAIASALDGGEYRAEFRILLPGDEVRWIGARGRAVSDDGRAHRMLGVAYDVTDVRTARDHAAHVLATMSSGYLGIDREWRVTYVNAEAERVLGRTYEQLVGKNLWEEFPGARERAFGHYYDVAVSTEQVVAFEEFYPDLGTWFEVRAVPVEHGLEVFFLDVTDRRHAEEAAQTAAERLELLARVSGELAATLDAEEAVAQLARLLVPALGSWCIVTLVDDDANLRDVGWWHEDPDLRSTVEEYARERMSALSENSFVARAMQSGQPIVIENATVEVSAVLRPGRARDLLGQLAPDHAMILPLTARGRTVGLVSIFRSADRASLDPNDIVTAREVASRAGLALDNARLYHHQQALAEGLQRSLLTAPPETERFQIAVRYQPAAQVAAVGGDWYDAFLLPDGVTVLVIGDVVGHDVAAAAAMGQLRGLLRGIAYDTQADPAGVLAGLDAAMEGLMSQTTATAVVAQLEQEGRSMRVRWANAGHPPPILLTRDGTLEVLAQDEPDLLLGFDPETVRSNSEVLVEPGTTALLYTDGLVERRGQSIDEGLNALRDALTQLDAESMELETLCDELIGRLLLPDAEDDVALVAVRLRP
ncbi:MAG TPA: SpoIIE family protein phosphatase [Nocardioidaceae bacterium]